MLKNNFSETLFMLEISNELLNGVLVIKLTGRLDGITSKNYNETMSEPDYASATKIVLDCAGLTYISSEGLRALLMSAKKAKSINGAFTLCSVNAAVNEVMVISGFGTLLGVHANIEAAIKAIN
jgi:anti-sigma B factor antagonist